MFSWSVEGKNERAWIDFNSGGLAFGSELARVAFPPLVVGRSMLWEEIGARFNALGETD